MNEQWRDIPDHPGYQASNQGRIRSIHRIVKRSDGRTQTIRTRILKGTPNHKGYLRVHVGKLHYIHDLVLEAWIGPRPPGKMHGCHADENKTNNRPSNLSWDTPTNNERAKHRSAPAKPRTEYFREYRRRNGDKIRERDRERDRLQRAQLPPRRLGRPPGT